MVQTPRGMEAADADGDGELSLEEAIAAGYTETEYKAMDEDGDGHVAMSEFSHNPFSAAHNKEHEEHRFGGDDHGPADLPKGDRKCTDVICLVVLFLFWGAIGAIVVLATKNAGAGGMLRLYKGVQLDGKVCGLDAPHGPGKAYNKQWFYAYKTLSAHMLCVKECPESYAAAVRNKTDTKACGRVWVCTDNSGSAPPDADDAADATSGSESEAEAGSSGPTTAGITKALHLKKKKTCANGGGSGAWRDFCKSKPMLPTKTLAPGVIDVCAPSVNLHNLTAMIDSGQSMLDVTSVIKSVSATWWTLFLSAGFGLGFAFAFLGLIKCGGRFVVYILLVMTLLIFIGVGTGGYAMSKVGGGDENTQKPRN